ncbi:hypothetical protein AeMF1_019832 [Aphanomyces euteiches]|nr:hypothetical protein AeMF1_019832 [Aphanomyces euteiches]KAH9187746.1 hypothetical protein AeNC1_010282 [Aphanomyces euteiches]
MASAIDFTKRNCSCSTPLFSKRYLRSHRSDSTKVVRCFPHCCPHHNDTAYCGSSLAVVVTAPAKFLEKCLVFFHFESSNDPKMSCGDILDERVITADRRRKGNPRGDWIPTQVVSSQDNRVVFEYKAVGSGGWHYGWIGGSSMHQRLTWHNIKAYVVLRLGGYQIQIVATITSPPFFVMSYRRSCKTCQANASGSMGREMCECTNIFRSGDSLLQEVLSKNTSHSELFNFNQVAPAHPVPVIAEVNTLERENVLAMLLLVVQRAQIAATSDIRFVFERLQGIHTHPLPLVCPALTCDLLDVCAEAGLALYHGSQNLTDFWRKHAPFLLDQKRLFPCYELWLQHATSCVSAVLTARGINTQAFLQSLLASCHAIDSSFTPVTEDPGTCSPLFEFFVAQLREIFLALDYNPPQQNFDSPYDGQWRVDLNSLQMSSVSAFSLFTIARWLTMAGIFDLHLVGHTIHLKSKLALFPTVWSELVLDNNARVFRVFPNGETSMTTCLNLLYGDYIGSVGQSQLSLTLVAWPLDDVQPRTSYICRVQVQANPGHPDTLVVSMKVSEFTIPINIEEMTCGERMNMLVQNQVNESLRLTVVATRIKE